MTPVVRTPGMVTVIAECPSCGEASAVPMAVTAELLVTGDGSVVRVKVRAVGVQHVCGQLALDGLGDTAADPETGEVLR